MKILLYPILLVSFSCKAVDLESLKKKTMDLLNVEKEEQEAQKIQLPEIPDVTKNAMDDSVYKAGELKINQQGSAFYELDEEKKKRFQLKFIAELFRATRQFDASQRETAQMLNVLIQGGSREGVYRNIVLGSFYSDLENKRMPVKSEVVEWVVKFGEKFLKKSFAKDSLHQVGFFTLKRILVESVLEVLDQMAPKEKDIYAWYAVLSSDMAIAYPQFWTNNKVRSNNSRVYHYQWAQKVPFQHIKSEVIVKLNILLNKLN
jgi:hypothetical protein